MYIRDDNFAINFIHSKFLSLLLTDKIRISVTERGSLKSIRKRCISRYLKNVHNIKCLLLTQPYFTVHM